MCVVGLNWSWMLLYCLCLLGYSRVHTGYRYGVIVRHWWCWLARGYWVYLYSNCSVRYIQAGGCRVLCFCIAMLCVWKGWCCVPVFILVGSRVPCGVVPMVGICIGEQAHGGGEGLLWVKPWMIAVIVPGSWLCSTRNWSLVIVEAARIPHCYGYIFPRRYRKTMTRTKQWFIREYL